MMQGAASRTDRSKGVQVSKALWIPTLWVCIACSRPVSMWFNQGLSDTTNVWLEGSPYDRNLLTVMIVASLIVLIARRRQVATLVASNGPLLLFIFYCFLSTFWSDFPDVAFKRWIRALGDVAMAFVVASDAAPGAALASLLQRAGVILFPPSIVFDLWRDMHGRPFHMGMTTGKNTYGAVSFILGMAALWSLLSTLRSKEREGRSKQLLLSGGILAMAIWSVALVNSVTAIGCFLIGGCLIIAATRWAIVRKPAVACLLSLVLIMGAVYSTLLNPHIGVVSSMGRNPDLTGRTEIWDIVIPMTPSPWVGAGFESFWMGSRLATLWHIFVWHPNEAHNGYIELYLNLGWIGVVLLSAVILTGFYKVLTALRSEDPTSSLRLGYFVVVIVFGLTEAAFRFFNPAWLVFLLAVTPVFKARRETSMPMPATGFATDFPELAANDRADRSSVPCVTYRGE